MSIWSKEIMSRDWFGEGNRRSLQSGYTRMHKIVDVNLQSNIRYLSSWYNCIFIFGCVLYSICSLDILLIDITFLQKYNEMHKTYILLQIYIHRVSHTSCAHTIPIIPCVSLLHWYFWFQITWGCSGIMELTKLVKNVTRTANLLGLGSSMIISSTSSAALSSAASSALFLSWSWAACCWAGWGGGGWCRMGWRSLFW